MNIHDNNDDIRSWFIVPQPAHVSVLFELESNPVTIPILAVADTGKHLGWVGMDGDVSDAQIERACRGIGEVVEVRFSFGPAR